MGVRRVPVTNQSDRLLPVPGLRLPQYALSQAIAHLLLPAKTGAAFPALPLQFFLSQSVMLVEQNARKALEMADRGYVLESGRDRFCGTGVDLLDDPKVGKLYLGAAYRRE